MGSYCTTKYGREPRGFILYRREVPILLYLLSCLMVYLSSIDCYFQQWRKNTKEELATPVLYPWCGIVWGPLHLKMVRRACAVMQLSCCYTQRWHPKIVLSCWRFHIYFCIVLYCERLDWSQQWLIVVFDAAHIVPSAVKINHFHDWSHPLPIIALWCCLPTLLWISESRMVIYYPF